jgi:hypothetical protein
MAMAVDWSSGLASLLAGGLALAVFTTGAAEGARSLVGQLGSDCLTVAQGEGRLGQRDVRSGDAAQPATSTQAAAIVIDPPEFKFMVLVLCHGLILGLAGGR